MNGYLKMEEQKWQEALDHYVAARYGVCYNEEGMMNLVILNVHSF